MKINWGHLCDYALTSAEGKASMMGVFGKISVPKLPATHLPCYLVFELELDYTEIGKETSVRIECVDADGTTILKAEVTFATEGQGRPADKATVAQVLRLPPLTFVKDGNYDINIFPQNGAVHHVPFEVVARKPAPPPIDGQPPLLRPKP